VLSMPANAQTITLKCFTAGNQPIQDWTIDLKTRTANWGKHSLFKVAHVNDRYFTLLSDNLEQKPGGVMFVIDRLTGDYKHAYISSSCIEITPGFCSGPNATYEMRASTNTGKCLRQQF
jgi:hypothetical protein